MTAAKRTTGPRWGEIAVALALALIVAAAIVATIGAIVLDGYDTHELVHDLIALAFAAALVGIAWHHRRWPVDEQRAHPGTVYQSASPLDTPQP